VLEQRELATNMAEGFDEDIHKTVFRLELAVDEGGSEQLLWHGTEDGETVTYDVDPYTSVWRRLGVWFMGLLPIESQL